MLSRGEFGQAHTSSPNDQELLNKLLKKRIPAEPVFPLLELCTILVHHKALFDRLARLSREPLASFATLCYDIPEIPIADTSRTASNTLNPKASSNTIPACRRSARVAQRAEKEWLQRPLIGFLANHDLAHASQPTKVDRKRKRTPGASDIIDHTGELQANLEPEDAPLPRQTKKARRMAQGRMSEQGRKAPENRY